jgi:hypothetical protein
VIPTFVPCWGSSPPKDPDHLRAFDVGRRVLQGFEGELDDALGDAENTLS